MAACRPTPRPRTTSARSRPTRTSTADSPLSRPPRSLRLPGPSHTARCDMTNGLSSPKATDRPPGPTPQAARGAPPPSDAFAGMLDAHQARTAIAEGHTERPEKPAAPSSVDSAPGEQQDQPATDTQDEDTAATSALLAAALPMPIEVAPVATEPVAAAATQMVVAGGAPTPVVQ